MAIVASFAELLIEWVFELGLNGSCLQLARQDVRLTPDDLTSLLNRLASRQDSRAGVVARARRGLAYLAEADALLSDREDQAAAGFISDRVFFSALGFSETRSVDVEAFEGADVVFDLNRPGLRSEIGAELDLLLETGTAEHIFHIPAYLANVCETVAVDGCVIHSVPVNSWVDHGFYQFSPTLFYDFYTANRFRILHFKILESMTPDGSGVRVSDYEPGSLDTIVKPRFPDRFVNLVIMAQRTRASTSTRVPIQGVYATSALWDVTKSRLDTSQLRHVALLTGPFSSGGGACWVAELPDEAGKGDGTNAHRRSMLILVEDGQILGRPHALHDVIRQQGGGAFSHWDDTLLFSASDNSDPNSNGRRYEIFSLV